MFLNIWRLFLRNQSEFRKIPQEPIRVQDNSSGTNQSSGQFLWNQSEFRKIPQEPIRVRENSAGTNQSLENMSSFILAIEIKETLQKKWLNQSHLVQYSSFNFNLRILVIKIKKKTPNFYNIFHKYSYLKGVTGYVR